MSYSPVKSSYEVGDVLTCYSDAVPLPTYVWTDMITNTDYVSQTVTVIDSMVGQAIFRCQITNVVGTANIFLNTTVNRTYCCCTFIYSLIFFNCSYSRCIFHTITIGKQ